MSQVSRLVLFAVAAGSVLLAHQLDRRSADIASHGALIASSPTQTINDDGIVTGSVRRRDR